MAPHEPTLYWRLQGTEVVPLRDVREWLAHYETDNRLVAQTDLHPGVEVSTVFLGINHNFGGAGAPLLFETVAFREGHAAARQRYSTWHEAEQGHEAMVQRLGEDRG